MFSSKLYSSVIANLTDGSVLRARLSNVLVLANPFLGVAPYTLSELLIFSNERSETFVDSFTDAGIKENLAEEFPNGFPVSVPVLDANVMCMFSDYKVGLYEGELREVLF